MLFGWGAGGGSPFGLLLVLGLILFMVSRRRRRVMYSRW
jgi:MYXO-CTERM domain-containing protein